MSLRGFLLWLQDRHRLTQIEIARRAGVSQSFVNKLVSGAQTREPTVDTCRKLVGGFPYDWRAYLDEHPDYREQLRQAYGWALGTSEVLTEDPCLVEAVQHLRLIFRFCGDAELDLVRRELRFHAEACRRAKRRGRDADNDVRSCPGGTSTSPTSGCPDAAKDG